MSTKAKLARSFAAHERFLAAVARAHKEEVRQSNAGGAHVNYAVNVSPSAGTAPASSKVLAEIAKRWGPVPPDLALFWSKRWRGLYEYRNGDFVHGIGFFPANKALQWHKIFAKWRTHTKVPERVRLLEAGLPLGFVSTSGRARVFLIFDRDSGVRLYPETAPKLSALPTAPITTTFGDFFEHALAAGYFFGKSRTEFRRYWDTIEPLLAPAIAPRKNAWLRFVERAYRVKLV